MQTRVRPINMAAELALALAARERRLVLAAQELELSPAELERELDLAALELGPVEREPSPPEAELRPVLIG